MKSKYKIGFLGMGTVAQGVWRHLEENHSEMSRRLGADYELSLACVRSIAKKRGVNIPVEKLTENPDDVVLNPEIDIVCELMGGVDEAFKLVKKAIELGKIVITANKAMLCEKGAEIFGLLAKNPKSQIFFEASVAGGIPIIKSLREGLVANNFSLIYGILNGTCNYILTRMERENASYDAVLADARRLGYVEADESLDIDGIDSAHKAAVLAYLAYGRWVKLSEMIVTGIRDIRLEDMIWAREFNYRIKLLASIKSDAAAKKISVAVYPALLSLSDVVANVNEVFNAVALEGDLVGRTVHIGRGAGQNATASAVISDIADAFKALNSNSQYVPHSAQNGVEMMPLKDIESSFYIRLAVKDATGTLAKIASIFASCNVSIELLEQKKHENADEAWLILTTHKTSEFAIQQACSALESSEQVLEKPFVLRIFENSPS